MPKPVRQHNEGDLVGPNNVKFLYWAGKTKDGKRIMAGECPNPNCSEIVFSIESRIYNGTCTGYCEKHCREHVGKQNSQKIRKQRLTVGEPVALEKDAPILLEYIIRHGEETKGKFLCGKCRKNVFIRTESHVLIDHNWYCEECGRLLSVQHNTDYKVGDIVNSRYNILWLEEDKRDNRSQKRQGWFKNLNSGIVFHSTLSNVLSGNTVYANINCSKPVQLIKYILEQLQEPYVTEKTYADLFSPLGRKLRYDFFLTNLNILIEYDGEQHFFERCFNRSKEDFLYLQQCDDIKNAYAKDHNIPLLRYSYFDYCNQKITLENIRNQIYDKEI